MHGGAGGGDEAAGAVAGLGAGATGGGALCISGVMIGVLGRRSAGRRTIRLSTVSLCPAECLEEGDRDEAPGVRERGVACLVPVGVVLSADDVEEVTSGEAELLARLGFVVVQRADDLQSAGGSCQDGLSARMWLGDEGGRWMCCVMTNLLGRHNSDGRLGGYGNLGRVLLALDGSAKCLYDGGHC